MPPKAAAADTDDAKPHGTKETPARNVVYPDTNPREPRRSIIVILVGFSQVSRIGRVAAGEWMRMR